MKKSKQTGKQTVSKTDANRIKKKKKKKKPSNSIAFQSPRIDSKLHFSALM